VKYADDLVLLAEEQKVLQGVVGGVIETGRCCGMDVSVGNTKAMRISKQSSPKQIIIHQKQPETAEYFNYFDSM
jgi:hypothetical protein